MVERGGFSNLFRVFFFYQIYAEESFFCCVECRNTGSFCLVDGILAESLEQYEGTEMMKWDVNVSQTIACAFPLAVMDRHVFSTSVRILCSWEPGGKRKQFHHTASTIQPQGSMLLNSSKYYEQRLLRRLWLQLHCGAWGTDPICWPYHFLSCLFMFTWLTLRCLYYLHFFNYLYNSHWVVLWL